MFSPYARRLACISLLMVSASFGFAMLIAMLEAV